MSAFGGKADIALNLRECPLMTQSGDRLYGQAADPARDTAATFDKWLRNTIETQPYATAIVALGIGWLLGRMHRPSLERYQPPDLPFLLFEFGYRQ